MTKKDYYFKQFDKIADLKLRDRCKELYDDKYYYADDPDYMSDDIDDAIDGMCDVYETKEGYNFWHKIINRTDLETNPYIITKRL